jgi:hypothetical protein
MKFCHLKLAAALFCAGISVDATFAADTVGPVRGPLFSATVRGPKSNEAIAMKGLVVTLGAEKKTWVCYDTDLMRLSLAWTGEFLEFGNTLAQIAWPPPPQVKGTPLFATKSGPGWSPGETISDPRMPPEGPLPKKFVHYRGLYEDGDQVVLKYTVGNTTIFELPGLESSDGASIITRTLNIGAANEPLTVSLCSFDADNDQPNGGARTADAKYILVGKTQPTAVGVVGGPQNLHFAKGANDLQLVIPPHKTMISLKILLQSLAENSGAAQFEAALKSSKAPIDLSTLCNGGPAHWTETVTTKGTLGTGEEPYLVDTITEPVVNPYNVKNFFGGFDFFSDGRAAICTFHGDVWVVSGIDDSLEKLTWKRYASGLFQPLGLKIVNDTVYVLGRDQITRLHDLNHDGEADYYENFNNDTVVTANYHEFALDLHTDRAGNFYFAKGAPWEPEVTSPSQGCLFKVSKDGSKLETIATGFRAPNGMTVGPGDEITVSDNQGHWMPSSKLNWVKKGGFYGMTPSAHRQLSLQRGGTNFTADPSDPKQRAEFKFKSWGDATVPIPTEYDKPMCWLPMNMDNSSGGQVWVTSDKWGPLKDHLLFMSYGKCTLFEVMPDQAGGTIQGAMVQLPLKFNSGVMRGRVNPKDGQVYVCGLKGWQTSATRDGGFYRVRYTGKPVRMPTAFHALKDGAQLTFSVPLDAKSAGDAGNYSVERWNYRWTGAYGSPEYSATNPDEKKHETLEVKSAQLSPDGRTLTLKLDDMKPSDQLKIKFSIDAADGAAISEEVYGTIYKFGEPTAR